ncbi:MAG: hypothetical protein JKP98_10590 [Rhodobacteraceae bacterium]|nr:hypothetical protein [Paracoccaceae bacterium]
MRIRALIGAAAAIVIGLGLAVAAQETPAPGTAPPARGPKPTCRCHALSR